MIRRLLHLMIGLLPLLGLMGFLYWILTTSSGLRFVIYSTTKIIPGHLSIAHSDGEIIHHLQFDNLSYQNKFIAFSAKNIDVVWQPLALLDYNTLLIKKFSVTQSELHVYDLSKKSSSDALPKFPINIVLDDADINQFKLSYLQHSAIVSESQWQGSYTHHIQRYQIQWQLNASLQGYPAQSHGQLIVKPAAYTLNNFELRSRDNIIKASGSLDTQWHVQWQIAINHLQQFLPQSSGRFNSTGQIVGDRATPIIATTFNAQQLHYQQQQINDLQGSAVIDPTLLYPSQIQLTANGLRINNTVIDHLALNSHNQANQQNVQLSIIKGATNLSAQLQGQLANRTWQGKMTQFRLQDPQWGDWQLQHASTLILSPTFLQLGTTSTQSSRGTITVNAQWHKQQSWSAQITANNFSLQSFQQYFPANLQLRGNMQLIASANQLIKQPIQATAQLNLSAGTIIYPLQQQQQQFNFLGGQVLAQLNASGVRTQGQINFPLQQQLTSSLNLPGYQIGKSLSQQVLSGQLHLNFVQLNLLQTLLPMVTNWQGQLTLDSSINGTVAKPQILGQLQLKNGQATIPQLHITLANLQISATGHQNGTVQINASTNSGGGTLQATGTANLFATGFPLILQIQGNQFLTLNTPSYQIYTSPQLTLKIQNQRMDINGKIIIPQANLAPPDFKNQSVELPDDVVFINQQQAQAPSAPLNFYSQIQLVLGDKVTVNVEGLKGQLTGNLQMMNDPQRPATAAGTLSVQNGQYKAYGQNLTISTGRLIFTGGPIINPGLRIQATKQLTTVSNANTNTSNISSLPSTGYANSLINATPSLSQPINTTLGVNVQGTLNKPQISLFSDPATLSQADILSYLLFDQPSTQISNSNAQLLIKAASSMNIGGSQLDQLTQELQHTFGLTQLSVGSSSYFDRQKATLLQGTSLTLGKKLSPRLSISYSVGLTTPINILQISYFLTSHWTLQSQTSSIANGVDLIYSIEKD